MRSGLQDKYLDEIRDYSNVGSHEEDTRNFEEYRIIQNKLVSANPSEKVILLKNQTSVIDKISKNYVRFVISLARKYAKQSKHDFMLELIQCGNVGLLEAIKRYDHTTGNRFSTYAIYWIRHEILSYIKHNLSILHYSEARDTRKLTFKLKAEMQRRSGLQEDISSQALAKHFNVSVEEVDSYKMYLSSARLESIHGVEDSGNIEVVSDKGGIRARGIKQYLKDPNVADPEEILNHNKKMETLKKILDKYRENCSPIEKMILEERLLKDGPKTTLEAIGLKTYRGTGPYRKTNKSFLSKERVRQIEEQMINEITEQVKRDKVFEDGWN